MTDFISEEEREEYYWARMEADKDWADRWLNAWDKLEKHGIVGPEDRDVTLAELERLASMLGGSDE